MMQSDALLVFIKNPSLGEVKTRLAAGIGAPKALEIYQDLLQMTRKTALNLDCSRYLYYSDFIQHNDDWQPTEFCKRLQSGTDLGQRMGTAFKEVLAAHSKVVIIGSDCPQLDAVIIRSAFAKLEYCDVVIGPAEDGGYYLLGLKEFIPELFEDIQWSTPNVLKQTLQKLHAGGKSFELCPTLRDLDDSDDWELLKEFFQS